MQNSLKRLREFADTFPRSEAERNLAGLKDAFGAKRTLFQCASGGTKVAVTAVRASDSTPCVFSNFNRPREVNNHPGKARLAVTETSINIDQIMS
jgi:hypothetical protein